ncbi:MAG: hypothetical protein K9J21_03615 [Bacteroidales bacterium]|nr:hypothetical protein [Bacteroidales bacterium]
MKFSLQPFIVILFFAIGSQLNAQETNTVSKEAFLRSIEQFPSYDQVTRYFFQRYQSTQKNYQIRFAKDPRGWYVYEKNPAEPNYVLNKQQIWSLDSLAYRRTNFRPVKDKNKAEQNFQSHYNPSHSRLYKIHPFYGYTGWDQDVIYNLKNYKNLPDSMLYGLARAYSHFALSSIRNQYEYSQQKYEPAGYEKIGDKRIDIFLENIDKSLKTYKELVQQNPDFKTIVGPIGMKYNNELMFTWQTLLSIKQPQLAEKYIDKVNYNEFTLSMAKNYLSSVSPDGLLFTFGDNDTYPLWYLQTKRNVREDVSVINTSLLNANWYLSMLKEQLEKSGKDGLISFTDEDFKDEQLNVAYFLKDQSMDKSLGLLNVIAFLRQEDNLLDISSEHKIHYMPTNQFNLPVDRGKVLEKYELSEDDKLHIKDTLKWTTSRSHFLRSELVLLDILGNNKWEYPVHYTVSGQKRFFMGLDDYIHLHGISYKLIPVNATDEFLSLNKFPVDVDPSYNLFLNEFTFDHIDQADASNEFTLQMTNLLRLSSGSIASVLTGLGKKDSALTLLNHIHQKIPASRFPNNQFNLSHSELYLQLKQKDKAEKIIEDIAQKKMKAIRKLQNTPANDPNVHNVRMQLQRNKRTLQQIIQLCKQYDMEEKGRNYENFLSQMSH